MRRNRAAATVVALAGFALAPAGGAREHGAGCCYDAHIAGGWNRLTNTATVSWTAPYPDLVSQSVRIGTTIAPTGLLTDDAVELPAPATSGPVSIGTPAYSIDAYVYAQVRFRCVPLDAAKPRCGPIPAPPGTTISSLPAEIAVPVFEPEQAQDFTLSASSDGQALGVVAGRAGATSTIWVIQEYGFYESVDFSAAAPAGLSVAFAPASSPTGTDVTVSAAAGAAPGRYSLSVTGAAGPLSRTDSIAVDVAAAPPAPVTTTTPKPVAKPKARLTVRRAGNGRGTVSGPGISCGSRCVTTRQLGDVVTLRATPASGSVFARWSGGCAGVRTSCSFVIRRAVAVTAVFARRR